MSRKAKLTSKRRRTEPFRFEVSDPTDAERALLDARLALRRAKDDLEVGAAEQAVEQAQAALDECFETILLRALPPGLQLDFEHEQTEAAAAYEAAVKAAQESDSPPPEVPQPTWDAQSFEVRLIAACDADGHSVEEWAEAFAGDDWTLQDRADLLEACYRVNSKRGTLDLSLLGKG